MVSTIKKKYLSFFYSKTFQFITVILAITFICASLSTFLYYNYLRQSLIPKEKDRLLSFTKKYIYDIIEYLEEEERLIQNLAQHNYIMEAFENVDSNKIDQLTKEKIITSQDRVNNKEQKITVEQEQKTKKNSKKLNEIIKSYQEAAKFKHLFIIEEDSTILFSTAQNVLVGGNINYGLYKTSEIKQNHSRVITTHSQNYSEFSFDPLLIEPALFLTTPVFKDKKLLGTLTIQIDEKQIYNITQQYLGLGETGEIVLAKRFNSSALFIAPTRHDPLLAFKRRDLFTKKPLPIQYGVIGEEGSGTGTDYRDAKVVVAWNFIGKVNWGIVVKIDQKEILQPMHKVYNIFIVLFLITLLFLVLLEIMFNMPIIKSFTVIRKELYFIPKKIKSLQFILFIIFFGITTNTFYTFFKQSSLSIQNAKNKAIENITDASKVLADDLENIQYIAKSIAHDLETGILLKENIQRRLKRDLKENENFVSITVAFEPKNKKLFAPSLIRINDVIEEKMIQNSYNYTKKEKGLEEKTAWYTKAIKEKEVWLDHSIEPFSKTRVITYSIAFFDKDGKEPLGVVSIHYSLDALKKVIENIRISQTSYPIIISQNGTFLSHPILTFIEENKTLLDIAKEEGNEKLSNIAKEILDGKSHLNRFRNTLTGQYLWIYTHPISINNWVIGIIYPEEEVSLDPNKVRQNYFMILFYSLITILLLAFSLFNIDWDNLSSLNNFSIFSILALITGLCLLWFIIGKTTFRRSVVESIIIDQQSLDRFINNLKSEVQRKHEQKLITIPCGIFLYSFSIPDPYHISFTGTIWHKYHKTIHTDIDKGFRIPQATHLEVSEPFIAHEDNMEIISWQVNATIHHAHDYSKFPLDQINIAIPLEHKDTTKNIILIPDLSDYQNLDPKLIPGIYKEFSFAGFEILQSFFNFHKIETETSFGLEKYEKISDHYQLVYNIILQRKLINPIILFFLPLIVIIFTLFAVFSGAEEHALVLHKLGTYSGVFFALVLIHRALRSQYPTEGTLYLEFAFFYTYLTLLLLIIQTLLSERLQKIKLAREKIIPLTKIFFWHMILSAWFVTTLVIFY